jgi:hypothetical protein
MGNDDLARKGYIGRAERTAVEPLRPDEQIILDALRAAERTARPALLALYYNGSNWLLYDYEQPRWLPRQE